MNNSQGSLARLHCVSFLSLTATSTEPRVALPLNVLDEAYRSLDLKLSIFIGLHGFFVTPEPCQPDHTLQLLSGNLLYRHFSYKMNSLPYCKFVGNVSRTVIFS